MVSVNSQAQTCKDRLSQHGAERVITFFSKTLVMAEKTTVSPRGGCWLWSKLWNFTKISKKAKVHHGELGEIWGMVNLLNRNTSWKTRPWWIDSREFKQSKAPKAMNELAIHMGKQLTSQVLLLREGWFRMDQGYPATPWHSTGKG